MIQQTATACALITKERRRNEAELNLPMRLRGAWAGAWGALTGATPTAFDAAGRGGSAHADMESAAREFRPAAPAARGRWRSAR